MFNFFIMIEAKYLLKLSSGQLITYEEIYSPFSIYVDRNHRDYYILIPSLDQHHLQSVIIVANDIAIRICYHKKWPKNFVSKIRQIVNCKGNDRFEKINYNMIPMDIQGVIASKLIEQISYDNEK